MASLSTDKSGKRRILFTDCDKKRRIIYLGNINKRDASRIKTKVEAILAAKLSGGSPDDETSRWIKTIDDQLRDKLVRVELLDKRDSKTLEAFLIDYIEKRIDVKPRTVIAYEQVRKSLVDYFGSDQALRKITAGDAERWRLHQLSQGLAENTIRRRCGRAKQFFAAAIREKLITENPFSDLKSVVKSNPSRYYFITLEESQRVIDSCPDAQWRLLFALCRFGGLRCPSEVLLLKWSDVNWETDRVTVHSPKTEHIEGKQSKQIPIFPELRPYLQEAWDLAKPGDEFVITRYRDSNINLRTQLCRYIQRAGLNPWPKLFQNLRSTRETELVDKYPLHVVCDWIGNSKVVAAKHYLQITDEHFEKATHNPTQKALATIGTDQQNGTQEKKSKVKNSEKRNLIPSFATECDNGILPLVAEPGLEPGRP